MFQDLTSLVVDIGTAYSRIGYGGDDAPKLIPHSFVSTNPSTMQEQGQSTVRVGDKHLNRPLEGQQLQSIFNRKGKEGYELDSSRAEAFLQHNLENELGVNMKDYSVLLSQDLAASPQENKRTRQQMAQFLFEHLDAANVFYLKAPVLSCFATGRSTALVLDSGEHYTRSVAVHEGFCLLKSAKIVPYGGVNLSQVVRSVVERKLGRSLSTRWHAQEGKYHESVLDFHSTQLLRDMKETLSVRRGDDQPNALSATIEYELPDRQIVSIERKDIGEGLIVGEEGFKGAPSMLVDTANSCDVDLKKELYSNLLMVGGNMLYGNTTEDIISRVGQSAPGNVRVKPVSVCSSQERRYQAWIGGSIVTSLSSFQSYWIGNQEWKEAGVQIIDKKCN